MKAILAHLVLRCHGDDRPDCPIIDTLADGHVEPAAAAPHAHSKTAGLQSGRPRRT